MKNLLLVLVFLACAASVEAQYANNGRLAGPVTVAQLPASHDLNRLYSVIDGASASDCTSGGGSSKLVCKWNGSAYAAIGGSSGVAWGSITGTLSTQTDLQAQLDLKAPLDSPNFTTQIKSPIFKSNAADPADAGVIRLGNNELIEWEKATPGTDWTLGINASDQLVSSAPFVIGAGAAITSSGAGGALGTAAFTAASAYEVPLTFSTGLNRSTNTITVNIGTTTCTNQFVSAISAAGAGTCTTVTLAGAQFANQGTTTTVLHGNGSGNPSFSAVALGTDVSGTLAAAQFPALTGDISTSAGSLVTTIGATKVTNAMLVGSIAYSKLSLTGTILNADLAGSIAYSKLSLTGAVLNADLAGSIAYSKLSLTGAILNADLAGSIAASKITTGTSGANIPLLNGANTYSGASSFSSTITQTSNSATAFESGPNGSTNPVLRLVNNTSSQADGISITGLAASSGTQITALSSGATSQLIFRVRSGSAAVTSLTLASDLSATFGGGSIKGTGATNFTTTTGTATLGDASTAASLSGFWQTNVATGGLNASNRAFPLQWNADTSLSSPSAAVVQIGDGGANANGSLKAVTATFTTVASDTATADSTLCSRASDGLLLKGTGTLGICLGTSTLKAKENVRALLPGLREVMQLSPISFTYKLGYGFDTSKTFYGLGAETVAPILPQLVPLDADGKPRSVDLVGMVPVLIHAVQEMQREIEVLKARP